MNQSIAHAKSRLRVSSRRFDAVASFLRGDFSPVVAPLLLIYVVYIRV